MSGLRREIKFSMLAIVAIFLAGLTPITPGQAAGTTTLVTCINLSNKTERISTIGSCLDLKEAQVNWVQNQSDSSLASGPEYKTITVCANTKDSKFKYRVIRSKCGQYQEQTDFIRTVAKPAQPVIDAKLSSDESLVSLKLANKPDANLSAPVAFYTITLSDGSSRKVSSKGDLNLAIQSLRENSNYSFSVSATSADGTSKVSVPTPPIKTPVRVVSKPRETAGVSNNSIPSPPIIALSAVAETVTANIAATGFTVNSTGGTVVSYSISPAAPSGMTFNTSTGSFTGTPTTSAGLTRYTVTATNADGFATSSFNLTVLAPVVDTVISVAAIGGVTAPVTGATPVTTVTAANGYTGSVSWSGSPVLFAPTTTYTATITLNANTGYTLTGVTANFFNVAGSTSVAHSANSGVITVIFPATAIGPATKALMSVQPSGAVNATVFTTQPIVHVTDASGNTIASFTGSVVASVFPASGTLSGTKTVTAVAGVATFTNLSITTAGSYSILFTPTALTGVRSDTFTVSAFGTAARLGITRAAGPSAITSGVSFTTQPQIAIRDASNNTVTSSTAVVTATVSAGGTLVGAESATATAGVATFSNLALTGTPGSTYTITYSVSGLETTTANTYLSQSCDGTSFTCAVGDIGPGGGKIFYYSSVAFLCGATHSSSCHYLEAAPKGWNTERAGADPIRTWAQSSPVNYTTTVVGSSGATETATASAIGWGYFNTRAIILQGNNNPATSAAALADSYSVVISGATIDDWFLPSYSEDAELLTKAQIVGLVAATYWSSTEATATSASNYAVNGSWIVAPGGNSKANGAPSLRPIRAF